MEYFAKAIEIDPGTPVSYINRGNAYFNMQDYERAITDFSKAIKLDPSYAIAYLNRGIVYRFLGETVQAEADFAKYKELTGQDAP